jgi:hypothetical protein
MQLPCNSECNRPQFASCTVAPPYRGATCNRCRNSAEKSLNNSNLITSARLSLGPAYGLARPLRKVELARLIGLGPDFVARLERGTATMSGTVELVIRMLLVGHRSPWHAEALVRPRRGRVGLGTV